jgi:3',5'-cyclic AMP phosphodiesterase CpdA
MPRFRLLHASDLHFARVANQIGLPDARYAWANQVAGNWAPVSSHNWIYADAFAAFAYANQTGLDAIVLSGDLATTGDGRDLRAARRFITRPATSGYLSRTNRPTLRATNKPVLLLPGNHDRFGSFHFPGRTAFDTVFGRHWQAGQGAQVLWAHRRGGAELVLFGVDFSLRRSDGGSGFCGLPLGFLGQGRAYPRRLQALRQATQAARHQNPNVVGIWVMHFEPAAADPSLALLDDQRLAAVLRQEQVAAILCGHTHASNPNKHFAQTPVFVCGTTTQHASAHGNHFHLLDIDISAGFPPQLTCRVFRYDPALGRFL